MEWWLNHVGQMAQLVQDYSVKLHDSVDRYFICLSSHLQMKWQITPAVIDTQSDVNMSMLIPLSVARLGATTFIW